MFFFFQAEDGIRDYKVTGVQTCALPIYTWTPVASMPAPRRFLDAVLGRGGIIYALGGTVGSVGFPGTQELTTVEAYDPSADTWAAVAPLSTPRGAVAAAVGRARTIFAIGGFDGSSVLGSVEAFTPGPQDMAGKKTGGGPRGGPHREMEKKTPETQYPFKFFFRLFFVKKK